MVLQKESAERFEGQREPWSVRDMLLANWPLEKIRSIVSRGGATPDPDCPEVEECFQYWVTVSRRRTSSESVSTRATTRLNVATTSESLGAIMSDPAGIPGVSSGGASRPQAPVAGIDVVERAQQALQASTGGDKFECLF